SGTSPRAYPSTSSAISSPLSSAPSRLRWISSAARIIAADCRASWLEDRLSRDSARRRLPFHPRVHRRADIGELALVDLAGGVVACDICEQHRVLTRVVGR